MIGKTIETGAGETQSFNHGGSSSDSKTFDWPLAYEAEKFINQRVDAFLKLNGFARRLSERMRVETGTDFFEWIDHLVLSPEDEKPLRDAGFSTESGAETPDEETVLH